MKAIYPGTFDPITKGHLDIIKRASDIFGELIVAVADNKYKHPLFSTSERHELIDASLNNSNIPIDNIKIESFNNLLVDFAKQHNCNIIIRGLRAISDFEYEFQMSCTNSLLNSEIQTLFLPSSNNMHFISSKFVKQLASHNASLADMVTESVATSLNKKFQ